MSKTQGTLTITDEVDFLNEKFGTSTMPKSLFKKLPPNTKLFLMNKTNGDFVEKFTKDYSDAHETLRPKALEKLLKDYGFDETKNYEPAAQAEEKKVAITASKSMDRWAKIVLINVVRAIFDIKMDLERGFSGLEDDLRKYFQSKKSPDRELFSAWGIVDETMMTEIRLHAVHKAYRFFLKRQIPATTALSSEHEALATLLAVRYKNNYFAVPTTASISEEEEIISEKMDVLIEVTADGLAKTGGFDKEEMKEEVKEVLPKTLNNLCDLVQELL